MSHPFAYLEAYYDGELEAGKAARLEEHLETCALCRQELDSLRNLSTLLQTVPPPSFSAPPEAFAAQVESRLPAHSPAPGWQRPLEIAWRLAPAALVAGWLLLQAFLFLAGVLSSSGLIDSLGHNRLLEVFFFQSLPALAVLFLSEATLNVFPGADWLAAWLAAGMWNLVITLVVGAGLWAWLASWWIYQKRYALASGTAGDFSQRPAEMPVRAAFKGNGNGSL